MGRLVRVRIPGFEVCFLSTARDNHMFDAARVAPVEAAMEDGGS